MSAQLQAVKTKPKIAKPDQEILFQQFFKSVGPRTYATQVKRAGNGNHFIVLTEGKRDDKTGEVRKTKVFIFSEDFDAFFKLLGETAEFVKKHPLPDEVQRRQAAFWAKRRADKPSGGPPPAARSLPAGPSNQRFQARSSAGRPQAAAIRPSATPARSTQSFRAQGVP